MTDKTWDVKEIKILLREQEDGSEETLTCVIFNDAWMGLSIGESNDASTCIEGASLDAARRLRDFLVYALPKEPE